MVEGIGQGGLDASMFNIKAQSMDICFDSVSQQQVVSFKFAMTVALPQLLQQVVDFQQSSGAAARGAAGSASPVRDLPIRDTPSSRSATAAAGLEVARAKTDGGSNAGGSRPGLPAANVPSQSLGAAAQLGVSVQGLSPLQVNTTPSPQSAPLSVGSVPTSPTPPMNNALNLQLVEALRENNVAEARLALTARADVNYEEPTQFGRTPLYIALEAGGNIEAVNLLLQAQSNVNAGVKGANQGTTPLHYAIQHYLDVPPLVIRMLLSARADLMLAARAADGRLVTPLDSAKMIAMRSHSNSSASPRTAARVRQLLNEVTEQPTVAVGVMEGGEVRSALFADLENDKIVFHTESSLCVYSLKQRRTIFVKKLRQLRVLSQVQHVSVNPALGTIAVCLEIAEAQAIQNVSIIWPTGQLQEEEPLKLSIHVSLPEGPRPPDALPSCVILSRTQGPQMLLSRLCDGQVYCWRLNSGRSQLVSEVKLMSRAGLIATSDNGFWIAAVNQESNDLNGQVKVWQFAGPSQQEPRHVATIARRPVSMAIASNGNEAQQPCLLAIAESAMAGQQQLPIEILMISSDGTSESVYRVRTNSPCYSLSFCYGTYTHLLSGHSDGSVVLYNLPRGTNSMTHDSQGTRSISISTDWTLLTSAEANYFRVFKVPVSETS